MSLVCDKCGFEWVAVYSSAVCIKCGKLGKAVRAKRGCSIDECSPAEWDAASRATSLVNPEPAPVQNQHPALWDLVVQDMRGRDTFGLNKYNTRLQPFNQRDMLKDAYQEALDLAVYLRGAIYERDGK